MTPSDSRTQQVATPHTTQRLGDPMTNAMNQGTQANRTDGGPIAMEDPGGDPRRH
jgi:hypothetical protein